MSDTDTASLSAAALMWTDTWAEELDVYFTCGIQDCHETSQDAMEGVHLLMRSQRSLFRKVPYVLMNITNHKTVTNQMYC